MRVAQGHIVTREPVEVDVGENYVVVHSPPIGDFKSVILFHDCNLVSTASLILYSVADSGFPKGDANFSQKLYENENKLTKGGKCIPSIPPPESASDFGQKEEISLLHDLLLPCLKVRLQEAHSKHITLQSVEVIAKFYESRSAIGINIFSKSIFLWVELHTPLPINSVKNIESSRSLWVSCLISLTKLFWLSGKSTNLNI